MLASQDRMQVTFKLQSYFHHGLCTMSHSTLDNPVAHSCHWDPGAAARAASIWALSRLRVVLLQELPPYGLGRWLVLLARGICNPCWARRSRATAGVEASIVTSDVKVLIGVGLSARWEEPQP